VNRTSDVLNRSNDRKSRGTDLVRDVTRSVSEKTHSMTRSFTEKSAVLKCAMLERSARMKPMIHETWIDRIASCIRIPPNGPASPPGLHSPSAWLAASCDTASRAGRSERCPS
jgi:hypothetical protein